MNFHPKIILLFLLAACPAQANQDAVIVRLAPVYSEASSVSPTVGQIKAGSRVSVLERKGGWKQIYSDEKPLLGWVRSFQVRENMTVTTAEIEAEPDSRGFLSGLASMSRKVSGFFSTSSGATSSGTATIGVRGLSEEELRAAKPDPDEFRKMLVFASNKTRLAVFARSGNLEARQVKHFQKKKKDKKKNTDK